MTPIRGIVFDFDATLGKGTLNKRRCYSEMYELMRREAGLSLDYEDYEKRLLASLSVMDKRRMNTQVELSFSEYYGAALANLGIASSPRLLQTMSQLILANYSFVFYPSAEDTLLELRRRDLTLSIVSNTVNGTTKPTLEKHGVASWFAAVIQSCDVGIRKPNPRIFQMALEQMATDPQETMSVGNSPYFDIYGAQQLGMCTVLVLTELSYREPESTAVAAVPQFTITQIGNLLGLFNRSLHA
jgi:FMN phosphatase YigB (HAD superfamily)